MNPYFPAARTGNLVVQAMEPELLVYDTTRAQANLLNHTAATIWNLCDGKSSVSEIAQRGTRALGAPMDETLVWFTLAQLSKKHLLQANAPLPAALRHTTRRDFLRAGMVGAAVVLPVIVTVAAPAVSQAASCLGSGQGCSSGTECCSTICSVGSCA